MNIVWNKIRYKTSDCDHKLNGLLKSLSYVRSGLDFWFLGGFFPLIVYSKLPRLLTSKGFPKGLQI